MDRSQHWDAARSVLLHLALLGALSVSGFQAAGPSARPGVWLQFYLQDGREPSPDPGVTRRETGSPEERAGGRGRVASARDPVTIIGRVREALGARSADAAEDSGAEAGASPARPRAAIEASSDASVAPPSATSNETAAGAPGEPDVLGAAGTAPLLATLAASAAEPLPGGAAAPTGPAGHAIPAAETAMLSSKAAELARSLRDGERASATRAWRHAGRRYTAVLTRQPAAGDMDVERVLIDVSTEAAGKKLHTQLQMKRVAFSEFTQLVDTWDREVQLHNDEIVGRFHSNSAITVGYDASVAPRFLGKVTTSADAVAVGNTSGPKRLGELFHGGIETLAGRIRLPDRFLALTPDGEHPVPSSRSFARDTRITFHADGSYSWQALGADAPEALEPASGAPRYLAAAPKRTLYLRGTVAGSLLVYAPERIVIEGSLVYAHDPRAGSAAGAAGDYLALVSDKDIEIARAAVTGPGDLEIDAALFARRQFTVTDADLRGTSTLHVFGSLTAGTLSASEPRYATRIEFDARFAQVRPPSFPMTDRYQLEAWDPHWAASEGRATDR